jgi:hypothetical protein
MKKDRAPYNTVLGLLSIVSGWRIKTKKFPLDLSQPEKQSQNCKYSPNLPGSS